MNVTWLGQSGYLLEGDGQRLVLDPYLSDIVEREQGLRRLVPPPCTVASLAPDALLVSHDHLDHYDPETVVAILSASPACRLAGPASVMAHGAGDGIDAGRLVPLDSGATVRFGSIAVTATPARHSDASAVGLLVGSSAALLWFSGDTLYAPELSERILHPAGRPPDAAFVCMNGRLGNMGIDDAVRLLAEIRPAVAVPSHYGMFAGNTADPVAFVTACARAGLRAMVMELGRSRAFPGDR